MDPIIVAWQALNRLYVESEMKQAEGRPTVISLLPDVNAQYLHLMSLCGNILDNQVVPGSSSTKAQCIIGYTEFQKHVQEWLDLVRSSSAGPLHTPLPDSPADDAARRSVRGSIPTRASSRQSSTRQRESRKRLEMARLTRVHEEERLASQKQAAERQLQQQAEEAKEEAQRQVEEAKEEAQRQVEEARRRNEEAKRAAERKTQREREALELEFQESLRGTRHRHELSELEAACDEESNCGSSRRRGLSLFSRKQLSL